MRTSPDSADTLIEGADERYLKRESSETAEEMMLSSRRETAPIRDSIMRDIQDKPTNRSAFASLAGGFVSTFTATKREPTSSNQTEIRHATAWLSPFETDQAPRRASAGTIS